jgi:PglZ domain
VTSELASAIVGRLTAYPGGSIRVVDPDGLVRSVPVLDMLAGRRIAAVTWSDPVESRLEWSRIDPGTPRIVIVDRPERADQLPVDVRAVASREIALMVDDLFVPLSPDLVRTLEWPDREAAFGIASELPAKAIGVDESASLLLRRIHQLDPETMTDPPIFLAGLLRLHRVARGSAVSPALAMAFARRVGDPLFPLATVDAVTDRARFVAWLADAWRAATTDATADRLRALLFAEGPAQLLDDYLVDGLLEPVEAVAAVSGLPFGVGGDSKASRDSRVERELDWILGLLDSADPGYQDWRELAERWADVLATRYLDFAEPSPRMLETRKRLNDRFRSWLEAHFHELASLPAIPAPAMVHKTAHAMEGRLGESPLALVIVDGLSLACWRALAPIVRRDDWHVLEATSFAWLPTITSISRQAIFAGRPPLSFAASIGTTAREPELWRAWWGDAQKLAPHEIGYARVHLRNLGDAGLLGDTALMSQLGRRVLGVVVEDVDHELHGERLGEGSFFGALRTWAGAGRLTALIDMLLDENYAVSLTSDHGYTEVTTIGVSQAGVTANPHGRFEVFVNDLLANQSLVKGKPAGRWRWSGYGLPADYHVVFAPLDGALKPAGDRILTHGGPTLEEVVVPWVRITR